MTANLDLVNLMLKVENHTHSYFEGVVELHVDRDLDLVSKHTLIINLKPGDSVYVPVKVFVSQRAQSGKIYSLNFLLKDAKSQLVASAGSSLQVNIKKSVTLFALVSNVLLEMNADSIQIPVRVSNSGNTAQKIKVICKYPNVIEGGDFYNTAEFVLPASRDTLISFSKAVNNRMYIQEGFDVNIVGLYANGELFSMAYIKVQNARNNRFYRDQSFNDSYDNNSITLSSQGMFSANEAYLLTGRGVVDLPQGKLGYNLDITTYQNSNYSPTMVRNTFIGYDAYNMGIKAGNINKNLDLNLSGRGGLFVLRDTALKNQYEVGYINSNTNLFGNGNNIFFQTGSAAWGTFMHQGKTWQLNSSGLYELNPMLRSTNMILANELSWSVARKMFFSMTASAGRTDDYQENNNAKYSFAAGFSASGSSGKLIVNSVNYLSSGYYPGYKRGALNLSERLTWIRPSGNIWAALDFNRYAPKYFSNSILFQSDFSSIRAEIGLSKSIFKVATLSLSPYFSEERNNSFLFLEGLNGNPFLRSWNLISTLNVPLSKQQYASLNVDAGAYASSFNQLYKLHYRSVLNYRYGFFNLMASVQNGAFYMAEIANNYIRNSNLNRLINITPSVQKNFMRNKLRTELGVNYSNNSLFSSSWQLTGRTTYEMFSKTCVFAAINHNRFSFVNGQYNSSLLEVGITKNMLSPKIGAKNAALEVFVFKDLNQNGIYDQGDSVAVNCLIYINDVVFITKADGTVVYKNLPAGQYRISLPRSKGWHAPDQTIEFDQKKRIEIPLNKTGMLKGKISYSYNQYSYEIAQEKAGIEVSATNENKETYVTRTNSDGQYVLFAPVGKYQIDIKKENLPTEVECKNGGQTVEIASGTVSSIDLILKVKQRKIEIKKFTSASLTNTKE